MSSNGFPFISSVIFVLYDVKINFIASFTLLLYTSLCILIATSEAELIFSLKIWFNKCANWRGVWSS